MPNNYRRRYYEDHPEDERKETNLPSYEEKTESETRKGIITEAPLVNARKSPEVTDNVVTVLREGDEVEIIGDADNYYKVMTPDHYKAYVMKKYCREV